MAFTNLNITAKKLAAGDGHSLAIDEAGRLYSWGLNDKGQLGHGDLTDRATPTQIGTDSDWIEVACGDSHSLALKSDGRLFGCGDNGSRQCGGHVTTTSRIPTLTALTTDSQDVSKTNVWACGDYSIIEVDNPYRYRVFGGYEQALLNGLNTGSKPYNGLNTDILSLSGTYISWSLDHIAAGPNGIFTYGNGQYGISGPGKDFREGTYYYPLGSNNTEYERHSSLEPQSTIIPQSIAKGKDFVIVVGTDRRVYGYSFVVTNARTALTQSQVNITSPIGIHGYTNGGHYFEDLTPEGVGPVFEHVSAGYDHAILRDVNGNMYAIGSNIRGQLGINSPITTNVTQVTRMDIAPANAGTWEAMACGNYHTLISQSSSTGS